MTRWLSGQNVQQEAADELVGIKRHRALFGFALVILPGEGDTVVL